MSHALITFVTIVARVIIFVLTAIFAVYDESPLSRTWKVVVLAVGMAGWSFVSMLEWGLIV